MREANFQGEKKVKGKFVSFGLITYVGDWGTQKDRASLVQPTAAAPEKLIKLFVIC